jgi:hypothetical protein
MLFWPLISLALDKLRRPRPLAQAE